MTSNTLIDAKNISNEEKARYYKEWRASGLKAAQFCKERQLPFNSFRYWCKRYQKETSPKGFVPVALTPKKITPIANDPLLNIGMRLPNQIQFQLNVSMKQLIELLRGVHDGIAIIR